MGIIDGDLIMSGGIGNGIILKMDLVTKFYIDLDESNYISIYKNQNDNIVLYICQPEVCLRLDEVQISKLLSLKTIIKETISYLSKQKQETLV